MQSKELVYCCKGHRFDCKISRDASLEHPVLCVNGIEYFLGESVMNKLSRFTLNVSKAPLSDELSFMIARSYMPHDFPKVVPTDSILDVRVSVSTDPDLCIWEKSLDVYLLFARMILDEDIQPGEIFWVSATRLVYSDKGV